MELSQGEPMADLIQRLLKEPYNFNFFQAISLLEEKFAAEKILNPIDSGRIRFLPDISIAFPPNDIASILEQKGKINFVLSFMGLSGISSPLPVYFSELLSKQPEHSDALYDFLTIFNHRIYSLFYKAWKKYHFMRCFTTNGTDPFTRKVAALAGITTKGEISPQRLRLLAYCGILAGRSRSKSALEAILTDYFNGIPVVVREFMPRWAKMQNLIPVGNDFQLGINGILGDSVYDCSGKFRVVIGPLKRDVYEQYLAASENIADIKNLIDSFIADPLEYDIEVQLQSLELIPVILGENKSRLGETAALGMTSERTDIQSIFLK
jgi:type VI secretion system protein ImpH